MIRITERDLHNIVGQCLVHLLREMDEPAQAEQPKEGVGYSVDTFVSEKQMEGHENYVIPAITKHLTEIKTMCLKYGIDFEWSITNVEGKTRSQRGWKITATAAMPDLKVAGYTYVGSVVPLTNDYALVAPSKEFKDNFEVLDRIKTTVSREKCSGCGRSAERGIYYVFREDATGELKKYGSQCAQKYLGISVDASINKVFTYLSNALGYFDFGDPEFWGNGGDWRPRGYIQVASACAYLAIFGIPEARFSFKYCKEYDELTDYYMTEDNREPMYPSFFKELERNYTKIGEYIASFYGHVYDYFNNLMPESDFEDAVKQNALYLGGAHVTKAGERYFRPGIYPYAVLKYFQGKRDEGIEVTPVEEFYGTREFNVEILNKAEKRSLEGGTYLQIYAKTANNEYVAWSANEDHEDLAIRGNVTVIGEYGGNNGKYCMLRRVKVMGANELDQRAERAMIEYPADGTRLRNQTFEVVKGSSKYVVLRAAGGDEYFVSNTKKDRWGEVVALVIEDWEQVFKPGNQIRLTGTVGSYTDRYGELKHTLSRVVWDQSSFPEIDYSNIPFEDLLYGRKKIIVNGKSMDIRDARCDRATMTAMVQFPDLTWSIYDYNKQSLSGQYPDYQSIRQVFVNIMRYKKYLENWQEMVNDHIALVKMENGELDKLSNLTWAITPAVVNNIPEIAKVSQKSGYYLVFDLAHDTFAYYNPEEKCWFKKPHLLNGCPVIDYFNDKQNFMEEMKVVEQQYNSIPVGPTPLNGNDLYSMVNEIFNRLFK